MQDLGCRIQNGPLARCTSLYKNGRVQLFISSTYRDLKPEREAVQEALRKGDSLPWGMEFFVSEPRRPLDVCLQELERCDAVILLVGARAGSLVPDGSGLTYTHAEKAPPMECPVRYGTQMCCR